MPFIILARPSEYNIHKVLQELSAPMLTREADSRHLMSPPHQIDGAGGSGAHSGMFPRSPDPPGGDNVRSSAGNNGHVRAVVA